MPSINNVFASCTDLRKAMLTVKEYTYYGIWDMCIMQ